MIMHDLLLLLILLFPSDVSVAVYLDYFSDSNDVNVIFLECYRGEEIEPHPHAVFDFFHPITGRFEGSFRPQANGLYRFAVTPITEAVIRCSVAVAGEITYSQYLSIAGKCKMPF